MEENPPGEKMILAHDPVPGYPKAFVLVLIVSVLHLAFIFIRSLFSAGGH